MTTNIAVKRNDRVIFASDSAASNSNRIWYQKEGKFHRLNDDLVVGNAGSIREMQIVQHGLTVPTLKHAESPDEYMYRLANAIKQAFQNRNANKDDENCKSSLIVCYKKHLYQFESDFQIVEFDENFAAIGSGQYYAIGVIESMVEAGCEDPEEIARKAVEVAIKYDPFTVGPVHMMEV